MAKVVVTGFGIVSAVGSKSSCLWDAILDHAQLYDNTFLNKENFIKGKTPEISLTEYDINKKKLRYLDKQCIYSIVATLESVKDAKLDTKIMQKAELEKIGVVMGSMTAQMEFGLKQVKKVVCDHSIRISPYTGLAFYYGADVGEISSILRTKGENCAVLTGSSLSFDGVMAGADIIRRGNNDTMIVGAGENIIFELFYNSLISYKKITKGKYLPFDVRRDGCFISNGAGALVLDEEEKAKERGTPIYGEIAGYYSLTASESMFGNNEKITDYTEKAILTTLEDACISPCDVDLVLPTADGSIEGDYYEMKALTKVFCGRDNIVYSPRPIVGNCLSFNGVIDMFVAAMSIRNNLLPGFLQRIDSGDESFNRLLVKDQPIKREVKNVLIISRSFIEGRIGGIVFKKYIKKGSNCNG